MFTDLNSKSLRKADLPDKFYWFLRENQMIFDSYHVLVAVSGGMDSIVLLHLFCLIRVPYHLRLSVIHMNHQLRGEEAELDELFVQAVCREKQLPFYSAQFKVRAYAERHRLSLEEAGRHLRFMFFETIRRQIGAHVIALAHHADDQAETILMNLFRGSGLRGLSGISSVRGRIIHPLLFATRAEIEIWSKEQKLTYRDDRSNNDRRYRRNAIRWDILVALKQIYGPSIVATINRAGAAAREVETLIGESAEQAIRCNVLVYENHEFILDIPKFLGYFISIQKELLMVAIRILRPKAPFVNFHEIDRCMALARAKTGRIELADRLEIIRASDQMFIHRKRSGGEVYRILELNQWNSIPEMHGRIRISRVNRQKKIVFRKEPDLEYIDAACAGQNFVLRSWRAGDHFSPLGMKGEKKLHDFFIDEKVPRHRRPLIPILEVKGKIVWVVGMRISDHVRLKPTTEQIVQLQWSDDHQEGGSQVFWGHR